MENYENETTVVNFIVVLVKQNSVNREKNKIGGTPIQSSQREPQG